MDLPEEALKDITLLEQTRAEAKYILENFRMELRNFWMVRPKELTKVPLNLEEGE